jgi:ABC-type transporter MlaC component
LKTSNPDKNWGVELIMTYRKPIFSFAASLTLAWCLATAALACPAEPFVRNAGQAFMAAAASKSPAAFTNAAARYADLRSISFFALGQYRGQLPKAKEAQYLALTRKFMGAFMAYYGSKFSGSGVTIVSCQGMLVNAKFTGGQKIVFRLSKAGNGFRVQDVSVSSVWLAQQMRSKFTGVIRKNGGKIDALLEYLAR